MFPCGKIPSGARSALLLCAMVFLTLTLSLRAEEQTYVVKRGDTLYGISRRFGVPVAQLTDRNGLARSEHIYAGQRLIVPGKASASAPKPTLTAAIRKAIASAPVKRGRWKYIVIHHSGVDTGTMEGMDRYHRDVRHMEHGLAYHFVIGNGSGMGNGEIEPSRRWTGQLDGGHLASEAQNKIAIGICLVGNFEKHRPSAAQLKSLDALVQALLDRCDLPPSAVRMHREINVVGTRCPGRYFPEKEFLSQLKKERS